MEVEIKNTSKISTKYYVWGVVVCNVLGNTIHIENWRAIHRNCYLIECSGYDVASIFFGVLGLFFAYIHWRKNPKLTGIAKSTLIGLTLIALATFTYGVGLGPGSICPTIDPRCH